MIRCFVSCCLSDYAVFRCELGWLLEHEIEFFKRESGIEKNPDYVFHKGILLDTLDTKYEHKKALEKFDDHRSKRGSHGHEYCFFPDDLVPHIDRMEEFITLAQDIIELRNRELPAIITPSSIETDEQEDIADLIDETRGRWVSQADFLNNDINVKFYTDRDLQKARPGIQWSKKDPLIGMDTDGRFLRSNGAKNPSALRYEYWLLKEHDGQNGE
jgi:hypothetical protein